MWTGRLWMVIAMATLAALGLAAASIDRDPVPPEARLSLPRNVGRATFAARPSQVHITRLLGRSVRGHPIRMTETGAPGGPSILVVGCVHGNEPAGIAVARDLISDPTPRQVLLWVVPSLNTDGVVAGTRQNAHGVDLNRNFPWQWRPIGTPGDLYYSGPRPLSEPESRIARRLILRQQPHAAIWFHQHENLVDESGGDIRIERRYASLTGMRLARLPRYPGSAVGWQNHKLPQTTAFVVELPAGSLGPGGVERFSDAILRLLR